jgi:succinate dehydrogenase/fumarate reductase flavoprotein subunit
MSTPDLQADLLVLGAGMAGMSAAAYAAQHGATVIVVEKSPEPGGSALLSGGTLWTAQTYELLREFDPEGDPDLAAALVSHYPSAVEWIRSLGVEVSAERSGMSGYGRGYAFDLIGFFARTKAIVESRGGAVITGARAENLIFTKGHVVGAVVADREGVSTASARAVLIATGGFQGDPAARERYLGTGGARLTLRANRFSTGDGLRLALAAGAATTPHMNNFYGHVVPFPLSKFEPEDYLRLSQLAVPHCLLIDENGQRFTDESLGYFRCAQAVFRVPGSRALMIGDAAAYNEYVRQPSSQGADVFDRLEEARREGANVASADTLEALGEAVQKWDFDGATLARTVSEFNAEMAAGAVAGRPPRKRFDHSYDKPPFFAMEVRSAITFAQGGIRIDTSGQVLDTALRPVPGLFAAGADAAGVFGGGYAGGLANALVFGLSSASTALGYPAPWNEQDGQNDARNGDARPA